MTREDVIRMARRAGAVFPGDGSYHTFEGIEELERFAALVAAVEREACAKAAADYGPSRPIVNKNPSSQIVGRWEGEQAASAGIEAAIRARSKA
jgi:hypothetical protein